MIKQPPERVIQVDILVSPSWVFHHVSPLLLQRKLFKKSRVLMLELMHLRLQLLRHGLIALMVNNQSFKSSGLHSLV